MARERNGFTPIENRMMEILRDGKVHSRSELHGCVYVGEESNVLVHVFNLRKKIRPEQDILYGSHNVEGRVEKGYLLTTLNVNSNLSSN